MLEILKYATISPEQMEMVIEGMRNPMNSWDRMDSYIGCDDERCENCILINCPPRIKPEYILGPNDKGLAMKLAKGGPVHAKYRRMIPVWVTINAPLYWWKEFDTYKIGTIRNSCSTMHKIHVSEFTVDNFSTDGGIDEISYVKKYFEDTINVLEILRQDYNNTQNKIYWRALIQILPDGYMMRATIKTNYEVLLEQRKWRRNHKLTEWHIYCDWIDSLPYIDTVSGEYSDE